MAARKRKKDPVDIAELQPDELNELKKVVREYLERSQNIDNEIAGLRESKKDLKDEFESRLDIKTLEQVVKVLQIEESVAHKGNYDSFQEILKDDFVNRVTDSPE